MSENLESNIVDDVDGSYSVCWDSLDCEETYKGFCQTSLLKCKKNENIGELVFKDSLELTVSCVFTLISHFRKRDSDSLRVEDLIKEIKITSDGVEFINSNKKLLAKLRRDEKGDLNTVEIMCENTREFGRYLQDSLWNVHVDSK